MKLSVLPLAVLLSLAAAQSLDALPPCAKQCANNLPQQCTNGGSSLPLVQCICTANSWLEGISCCIKDKCPASDVQSVISGAQQICAAGGVTLASTLPPCASSTGAATGASTTGTGSTSMSMSMSGTASTTGTAGTASKQSGSSTSTPTSSSMSSTSSAATQSTGGAAHILGSHLGAAGAALAAVALL